MPTPSPTLTYSGYLPLVLGGCGYLIDGRIVPPTKYYLFNGQRIAMRQSCNGAVTYLYHDSLGSTVATSDGESTRYWPYGGARAGEVETAYQYTGQRLDSSTLYYYGARWYDGSLGRFIQPDTIVPEPGSPQSLNRFAYCLNNPMGYADPTGRSPVWWDRTLGGLYAFANDMTWGIPDLVFGTQWQEEQSAAFQQGQVGGRQLSQVAAVALTVDGAGKATAAGIAAAPTLAAALPTGGLSLAAVAAEGEVMLAGTAESLYGTSVLAYARGHPVQGPRYAGGNFRRNLEHHTPIPRGMRDPQAHHMLPQAFQGFFQRLGINIHEPQWGAWVEGGIHQHWSAAYNAEWEAFFASNRNPTLEAIIEQARLLASGYGISWPGIP